MQRRAFPRDGLHLSYLDSALKAPALIALHAHTMEAVTFAPLAEALAPAWRLIALDQRGHGYSDHAPTYTRDDYLGDLDALYDHLHLSEAVLLGNSLGGVNAYQFAARHPQKVRGLIIEDIGVELKDVPTFMLAWQGEFPTREALADLIGPRFLPYLEPSFRETQTGWKLAFDPLDMVTSGKCLLGNHWNDWLAIDCPALIIRGRDSRVTTESEFEEMATRRPNTRIETLNGSHVLHFEDPAAFEAATKNFLSHLSSS